MSLSMIIFLPIAIGFGFLYWASQLDENHPILALAFQLFFIPLAWISINFALINARLIYSADSELITSLGDLIYYLGWMLFIVGAYLVYNICLNLYDMFLERKRVKEEEKYG